MNGEFIEKLEKLVILKYYVKRIHKFQRLYFSTFFLKCLLKKKTSNIKIKKIPESIALSLFFEI